MGGTMAQSPHWPGDWGKIIGLHCQFLKGKKSKEEQKGDEACGLIKPQLSQVFAIPHVCVVFLEGNKWWELELKLKAEGVLGISICQPWGKVHKMSFQI